VIIALARIIWQQHDPHRNGSNTIKRKIMHFFISPRSNLRILSHQTPTQGIENSNANANTNQVIDMVNSVQDTVISATIRISSSPTNRQISVCSFLDSVLKALFITERIAAALPKM